MGRVSHGTDGSGDVTKPASSLLLLHSHIWVSVRLEVNWWWSLRQWQAVAGSEEKMRGPRDKGKKQPNEINDWKWDTQRKVQDEWVDAGED